MLSSVKLLRLCKYSTPFISFTRLLPKFNISRLLNFARFPTFASRFSDARSVFNCVRFSIPSKRVSELDCSSKYSNPIRFSIPFKLIRPLRVTDNFFNCVKTEISSKLAKALLLWSISSDSRFFKPCKGFKLMISFCF